MKKLSIFSTLLLFLVYLGTCKKNDDSVISINSLNYFLENLHRAGFVVDNDSIKTFKMERYRIIHIVNSVNCIFTYPPWYTIVIGTKHGYKPEEAIKPIGLPIVKDSNGLSLFRIMKLGKRADAELIDWTATFFKDSSLYEINQNASRYGNLLWFARIFRNAVYIENQMQLDSILSELRKEQEQGFFISEVREKLHSYKLDKAKNNFNCCYNGEIILSPIDTLTPEDSAAFRDCVIRYRRDHGMEPAFIIDTNLLKSLKIPLDPIEEGLKRYYKEFAKKSG